MENRLIEIETKLAYQEDVMEQLNKVLVDQQNQIDRLQDTCRVMVERVKDFMEAGGAADKSLGDRPPHY